MTARLKLPAYGKSLINERRQGRHPRVVHVHYSESFGCSAQCEFCATTPARSAGATPPRQGGEPFPPWHPAVQVSPAEFRPFAFDWTVVTGCMVAVFDWRHDIFERARAFYELVGELGRFAGPVQVYRLERVNDAVSQFAFQWDAGCFASEAHGKEGRWPFWWPPETEALNAPRRRRWWDLHEQQHGRAAAA